VRRKTQAFVEVSLRSIRIPSDSQEKSSTLSPVLLDNRAASVCVMGMVVSLQQAEHFMGMHGNFLPMNKANHPPYSRRGDDSGGLRAIRVVWISFRPSEPETGVRILHRPPRSSSVHRLAVLLMVKIQQILNFHLTQTHVEIVLDAN
jgi:hypothetical protein